VAKLLSGSSTSYLCHFVTHLAEEEVTFQDIQGELLVGDKGFSMLRNVSRLAHSQRHNDIWIDTCCIDKTSSAELFEAINSM
jgi:hypothetical protein